MGLFDNLKLKSTGFMAGSNLASGGLNALYNHFAYKRQLRDQKDWWYAQQKYLEQHNSPAYQSMLLRKAGLNPFTSVQSQPLGNVNSQVPQVSDRKLFDPSAIRDSLLAQADIDLKSSQVAVNGAQIGEITQRTSNLLSEWFILEQDYLAGEITLEQMRVRWAEELKAYHDGYTPTANKQEAHVEGVKTAKSEQALNEAKTEEARASAGLKSAQSSEATAHVNLLNEQYNKLKRENNIGDKYDEVIKQYESEILEFERDLKSHNVDYSAVHNYALKYAGIDLNKLPNAYIPLVVKFVNADMNGQVSDKDWNTFLSTMSNYLGSEIDFHRKSSDPDHITPLEDKKLDLDIFKANVEANKADNDARFKTWQMAMQESELDLSVISTIADLLPIINIGFNSSNSTRKVIK